MNNNRKSCTYASLCRYNNGAGVAGPAPASTVPSMAIQVVPQYGGPSYGTLKHDGADSSCNGYFTIKGAYPHSDNGCALYTTRACSDGNCN